MKNYINDIVEHLTRHSSSSLDLGDGEEKEQKLQDLVDIVNTNANIILLNLAYNKIEVYGAITLARAIQPASTITTLSLQDNNIGNIGVRSLAGALKSNSSITSLNLALNAIQDRGIKYISTLLKTNSSISSLNLNNNQIGSKGAKYLAESLVKNDSITALDLNCNRMGALGAKYLAKSLQVNTNINIFYLGSNNILSAGAIDFAQTLQINTSLTELNLSDNGIQSTGAVSLREALMTNASIISIDDLSSDTKENQELASIVTKNNKCFNNKCSAVQEGRLEKFSLKDIQTFIPILKAKMNNSADNQYTETHRQIMWYFYENIYNMLFGEITALSLPDELKVYIAYNYLVPSDIKITPTIAVSHDQGSSKFTDIVEGNTQGRIL